MNKGDIYYADLGSPRGSEQSGLRPVLIFQNDSILSYSRTVIIIPLTTNIKRSKIPGCVLLKKSEGGLSKNSVALCYQIRAIDKSRLKNRLGSLLDTTINKIEKALKTTLNIN